MIGKDNQYLRFTKYDLRFLNETAIFAKNLYST